MVYLVIAKMLVIILCWLSSGDARGDIEHGPTGTANHDYFQASQDPQIKHLLYLVEKHHLNACPHNTNGVLGDIALGKYHLAIADLQYTLDRFVNHTKALQLMGSLVKLTESPSLGISYYEKALKLYPQYAFTHAQYGAFLVDIGRVDAGITRLKEAIEMDPNLVIAHAWLAKA